MDKHIQIDKLLLYGLSQCQRNWFVEEESCTYHRIYFVYSGDAVYESDMEKITLKKGCLYIFPIYKKYKITHNIENPLKCQWFHVTLSDLLFNNLIEDKIYKYEINDNLLKALEGLVTKNNEIYIIINILNSLLALVFKNIDLLFIEDTRIKKIIDYIYLNYNKNLTNSELSKILNIDTRYFIRLFSKYVGQTPQKYISYIRALEASRLLINGEQVKFVARKVGFTDTKAFTRFFKNQKKIAPSLYKESYFKQP